MSYDPADRRIVLGGAFTTGGSNPSTARVVRLHDDGSPDLTFGTNGWVDTGVVSSYQAPVDVVAYGGKVTVAAPAADTFQPANGSRVVVSRFDALGTPDSTFGVNGRITTALGSDSDADGGLALDTTPGHEGQVLVGGTPTGGGLGVVRLGTANTFGVTPALAGVDAAAASASGVTVSWAANAPSVTGYDVQRSADGTTWSTVATIANPATTTYADTGLAEGTTYSYRVRALVGSNPTTWSDPVEVTTAPAAPAGLTASADRTGGIGLTWSDVPAHEDGYEVLWSSDGTDFSVIDTLGAGATAYTDANPTAGSANYYQVKATLSGQESAAGNAASATPAEPPVAKDDSVSVAHGQVLVLDAPNDPESILANDAAPAGLAAAVKSFTQPAEGELSVDASGRLVYAADAHSVGTYTFTYVPTDGPADGAAATVTVAVTNAAPVAQSLSTSIYGSHLVYTQGSTPALSFSATDPEGDALTYEMLGGGEVQTLLPGNAYATPHGGIVIQPGGSFVYTPDDGFVGLDRFVYRAGDGFDVSAPATYTIRVRQEQPLLGNDVWQVPADPSGTAQPAAFWEGGVSSVTWNDSGVAAVPGELTDPAVGVLSGPSHGTLVFQDDGECTYQPDAGYAGPDSFTYHVPSQADVPAAEVEIQVVGTGTSASFDWPGEPAPAKASVAAGTTLSVDASGGLLSHWNNVLAGTYGAATATLDAAPSHGTAVVNADGSFTYTARDPQTNAADFTGWDYFKVRLHRSGVPDSSPVAVAVDVTDSLPEAAPRQWLTLWTYAGQPQPFDVRGLFADGGHPLSGLSVSFPAGLTTAHGQLSQNADGGYTYTPDDGFTGTDVLTYRVNDGVTQARYKGTTRTDVTGSGYNRLPIQVRPLAVSLSLGGYKAGDPDAIIPLGDTTSAGGTPGELIPLHLNVPAGLPKGTTVQLSLAGSADAEALDEVGVWPTPDGSDPAARLLGAGKGSSVTWVLDDNNPAAPAVVWVRGEQAGTYDGVRFDLKVTPGDDGGTGFFGNPAAPATRPAGAAPATRPGTKPAAATQKATTAPTGAEAKLIDLSFDATDPKHFHQIAKDDGSGVYYGPQWHDANGNGVVTDEGDHAFPVCYTRSGARAGEWGDVKFKLDALFQMPGARAGRYAMRLELDGRDAWSGFGTVDPAQPGALAVEAVATGAVVAKEVGFWDLKSRWQIKAGNAWFDVGKTSDRIYITNADPLSVNDRGSVNFFDHVTPDPKDMKADPAAIVHPIPETVLAIGCAAAAGQSAKRQVLDSIWAYFHTRAVVNLSGVPMTYWGAKASAHPKVAEYVDALNLIREADGRCGAWSLLTVEVFAAQGIYSSAEEITVNPFSRPDMKKDVVSASLVVRPKLPAQNNNDEDKTNKFGNHWVVELAGPDLSLTDKPTIFDPSYGEKYSAATFPLTIRPRWRRRACGGAGGLPGRFRPPRWGCRPAGGKRSGRASRSGR